MTCVIPTVGGAERTKRIAFFKLKIIIEKRVLLRKKISLAIKARVLVSSINVSKMVYSEKFSSFYAPCIFKVKMHVHIFSMKFQKCKYTSSRELLRVLSAYLTIFVTRNVTCKQDSNALPISQSP